jgi:DNA-binding MarR family transcriptional regulator
VTSVAAGDVHDPYACAVVWATLTRAHAAVSEQLGAALQAACGLSANDFDVMLRLRAALPGGVRVAELGTVVRLSQPAVSRMVMRLEHRGLLARSGASDDRRGVIVALTPAGDELLSKAIPIHAQCLRQCFLDHLSPEESAILTAALDRVAADRSH